MDCFLNSHQISNGSTNVSSYNSPPPEVQNSACDFYLIGDQTQAASTQVVYDTLAPQSLQLTLFKSAEEFLIHLMRHPVRPGVARIAYMHLALEGMSGLDALTEIQKLEPSTCVILLAERAESDTVLSAWHAGASDLILAPYTAQKIIDGIQRVLRLRPHNPQASSNSQPSVCYKAFATLTRREREIGQMVVNGQRNQQIGVLLHISISTVKMHRAKLMRKLKLNNAAQLISFYHKCNAAGQ